MSKDKPHNVINLADRRRESKEGFEANKEKDLQDLLAEAHELQRSVPVLCRGVTPITQEESEALIRVSLVQELKRSGNLNATLFACANYSAGLLMELFCKTPKYWTAFDFLEEGVKKKDPLLFQQGADMCFLISSVFTERANWRAMKIRYYRNMGIGLYHSFYSQTKKEIGFYMSENFLFMSKIVSQGLESIKGS